MDDLKVGKTISYALRHNPEKYSLKPDEEGYVLLDNLFEGLKKEEGIEITFDDINRIIANSDKKRYEINEEYIRATYGHSGVKIKKERIMPPETLYHGTTHKAFEKIKTEGLKSMDRQFVHLSEDLGTARIVGKRRDKEPIILIVHSKKAYENGVGFYKGNDTTWLSDAIPVEYIEIQ